MEGPLTLITGASSGIGLAAALELSRRGHRVVMACRSLEKARPLQAQVRAASPTGFAELVPLELSSLAAVREGARDFLARGLPLDVLLNNAGVAGHQGLTADGFEIAFGTNHLGHFLLTQLLLPRLKASAGPRVINVSSHSHYGAKALDFERLRQPPRTLVALREYEVSKLCNVLHARELARREPSVWTAALHPGQVASDAWRKIPALVMVVWKRFMLTNAEGARTSVHCASGPQLPAGKYWDHQQRVVEPSALAQDDALAAELWRRSEAWVA
jgi:NAD(P)-dependent dehydrogenase (short-subunit alcohol dehydrogenase family)